MISMEEPGILFGSLLEPWAWRAPSDKLMVQQSRLVSNGSAPSPLDGICPEGWRINDGYSLSRCFLNGVVFQVPTLLSLVLVIPVLLKLRQRKRHTTTPVASRIRQARRLVAQKALTLAYGIILVTQAFSVSKNSPVGFRDVACFGRLIVVASLIPAALLVDVEVQKTTKPSGASLMYWLSMVVATQFLHMRWTALVVVGIFILEWYQPRREGGDERIVNPYDQADIFSRLTFSWMTALMKKGYESFLTLEQLPEMPSHDRADYCNDIFEQHWNEEVAKRPGKPSIFVPLLKSFGAKYALGGLCKALQDALAFAQPQLLKLLIAFVTDYTSSNGELPLTRGLYIALAMFMVSVVQTIILHQYFERSFGTGMNVRTALTNAIFRKALVLSNEARATRTTGDTVNLMSIDTQRLQDVCTNGNMLWSGPFQIILCLTSLYNLVGNSMWVGVVVLLLLIPINSYLASTQKNLQKQQMKDKDLRTRLTSELLSSIKSIKLYAWEDAFVDRLEDVRDEKELVSLRKIGVFQACMSYIWTFTPFLVSCSTFAFYVLVAKKPLTTDIVFPALALFNMLGFPMAVFPMLITSLIESNVAIKRITNYLTGEEVQMNAVNRVPAVQQGEPGVKLEGASFVFKEEYAALGPYAIKDANLVARAGELTCVVGRVGSGKSSLLQSILGDVRKVSGTVTVAGSVAYVAQNPWIFNGSVRDNILFGLKYDEELYAETISACALRDDLAILPEGDSSVVGEKGISLSGGQKARLSLARAVYARADVYLLDDPLSAVDEHVGQHIIKHILGKTGLLAKKTVILATNSIPVLQHADQLAMVADGSIVEVGPRRDFAKLPRIKLLIEEHGRKPSSEDQEANEEEARIQQQQQQQQQQQIRIEETPMTSDNEEEPTNLVGSTVKSADRRPSVASLRPTAPLEVRKEHVETGKVSWNVYKEYARVCGYRRVAFFIGVLFVSTSFTVGSSVWLKHWAEANTDNGSNDHIGWYLGIYAILGVLSAAFTVLQSLTAYVFISINAARKLHDKMLKAVVRAPMSFFETNPLGRIINRFSSDVYRVDQQLMRVFFMLFANCIRVGFTIGIICYSTPTFIVIAAALGYFYLYYQRYYLRTSRELKRLDSVSKSPIFAQFQETLDGIATVRAFNATGRFNHVNRCFIDTNNKAYFPSISANRWLAVRLELVGSIIILAASGLAVLALPSGRITAGVIGLALSYALQVTQALNWIVRMTVEVETNIVSVERMMEYSALPAEAPSVTDVRPPTENWPEQGAISMVNYSTRYRPELPLVLKSINLDIKPGEKIGIVGRTGAGKSSLTLALFRLIEATDGHITIDAVHTDTLGLKDLRSNLSIIPQDSQLFEGTARENLDPAGRYTDVQLWHALELSHLKSHISSMDGQLDTKISEGGSNLSAGQRQLLSLARALLTDSKVLVLDEATAAVDVETDQLVQEVIRKEFADRTILTIAHRINTILDSDRVVVLSYGEVVEFDKPETLMKDESTQFYALCKRGGIL